MWKLYILIISGNFLKRRTDKGQTRDVKSIPIPMWRFRQRMAGLVYILCNKHTLIFNICNPLLYSAVLNAMQDNSISSHTTVWLEMKIRGGTITTQTTAMYILTTKTPASVNPTPLSLKLHSRHLSGMKDAPGCNRFHEHVGCCTLQTQVSPIQMLSHS